MKKYLNNFRRNIYINKNLFVFLLVIVIIGLLSGAIFSMIIDTTDKKIVFDYLNDFFNNARDGKLYFDNSLFNSLIFTLLFVVIIWFLGVSVIGFFIILFLLFLKAFVLGFSLGSIILNFKIKGILLSFLYVFPHQVVNVLIYMLVSAYALIISFKVIRCFTTKKTLDFKGIMNRYTIVLLISIFVLVISSVYEIYLLPHLFTLVFTFFK
ncbi:MAG: stage II sporulation protein M [Bacilli bacterium]|nr:stage II sporulation protein M [Bacilli bacterium]